MASEKKAKTECAVCHQKAPCAVHCNDDRKHQMNDGYCLLCGHYDGSHDFPLDTHKVSK